MRYLKLFESWEDINGSEISLSTFSENEKMSITFDKDYFNKIILISPMDTKELCWVKKSKDNNRYSYVEIWTSDGYCCRIYQMPDDYFLIHWYEHDFEISYYKIDQWDSVKLFLKEKEIIK